MKRRLSILSFFYIILFTGCAVFEPAEEEFDIESLPPTAAGAVSTVTSQVAASSDDAEQNSSGKVSLTSSDLELTMDRGNQQVIGMRFKLDIPQGAIITDATIQFTADEVTTGTASLQIFAEASDNAETFVNTSNNISSRPTTSASVSWSPSDWSTKNASTESQRTPSLTSITQEIVSRSGWTSGNYIAYTITGTGTRTAESYNGVATSAPKLIVSYTLEEDVPPPPPVGDFLTVTTQVTSSTDDAEEMPSGSVSLTSTDLELTTDRGNQQIIGLRFKLDIPQGAQIEDTKIQFTVDEVTTGTANFKINAEASDNAKTFSTVTNNIKNRPITTATVNWTPPDWNTGNSATADQQTPSLAAITQEVVGRPGWNNGNYIAYIITGTGTRTAESFNGVASAAPTLTVSYSLPPKLAPVYEYQGFSYEAVSKPVYDHGYLDGFMSVDSDADGLPDSWELAYGLDPTNPNDATDPNLDPDQDLLTGLEEFLAGTDPTDSDSDGDGLPDGYEIAYGLNPSNGSDALLDSDGDGYSNLDEFLAGSDPGNPSQTPVIVVPPPLTYSINISWDAPTTREDGRTLSESDINGFSIYYGLSATSPDVKVNLNDPTQRSYIAKDLAAGSYYFTVTAIDKSGNESKPSTIGEITVPQ